ncbi:PAPA-1-domain-containing protein [Didymella exigua CBS 183.55]|uniref:PAPA-1-domain-containing protein n=1 Tax=Didymella exigua CBS 183.55 TaxID=1150837 RepID=A0A6A5RQ55_9PLEO|nr:PAPA-1-domain-containing protein [Didymella exigua CBS 183.55]KAF1929298.1 PAPA-1-domain-containing protein [Didymella exigua CBS 183.55]
MADRAAKRLRRVSTEYEESEDNNEWNNSRAPTATSTRPRRGTAGRNDAPSATIQRSSPEEARQSLSLTVKSSPNKLRQATGVPAVGQGTLSRNNIVSGKRARTSRVVREIDSEEDEDEDDNEDEADEVSAMDVDDEEEDGDVDAEGSEEDDMDAEGDGDDEDPIVVPTSKAIPVASKPKISVTKAQDTVEAKEMVMSDDDELSDPDSDLEDMEDAEGEDEDAEGEDDDELGGPEGDVDMDSDEDMSRDQTPDISKLTRRQRAVLEQEEDGSLLALSNEAQKKKHLTAEEHAMRRAEMARRRKNLSEKRNEEEKLDTINRLLKKQPPKRGRKSAAADLDESGQEVDAESDRANPLFVRYIQSAKGTQLAVPDEWLQAPVGSLFAGKTEPAGQSPWSGRMVEEVA